MKARLSATMLEFALRSVLPDWTSEPMLNYCQWEEEDMLAEGIERLATVINRMLNEEANGGQSTHREAAQEVDAKNLW
jgi:hypothetical protein